jgi:hypothetical protein
MQPSMISGGFWVQAPYGLGQWLPTKESLEKAGVVLGPKDYPKINIVLHCPDRRSSANSCRITGAQVRRRGVGGGVDEQE